jgi:hypothetical protein
MELLSGCRLPRTESDTRVARMDLRGARSGQLTPNAGFVPAHAAGTRAEGVTA